MTNTLIHVVRRGEHLYEIAARYALRPDDIWSLPENSRLRGEGRTPEILAEGDILRVPVVAPKSFALRIGATNEFALPPPPTVDVFVRLVAAGGRPLANEPFEVDGLGSRGTTREDGTIELRTISVDVKTVIVRLPKRKITLRVHVGLLDPVTTTSGKAQRLAHLGYAGTGDCRVSRESVSRSVAAFLSDHAPCAVSEADVEKALVAAHGS